MLIQQPCSFFNLCSCSCLPWAAPRLCCRAPEPVKFPTPLHLRLHCPVFPISGSFQSGASPSSTGLGVLDTVWSTWSTNESHRKMTVRERLTVGTHHAHYVVKERGQRGQRGQGTTSIGSVLYVERLTAGSTTAARKCLLITRKIMIPPPDSRDPPDGPPYFAKKMFSP